MKNFSMLIAKLCVGAVSIMAAVAHATTNTTTTADAGEVLSADIVSVTPSLPAEVPPAVDVDSPVLDTPEVYPVDLVVSNPVVVAAQAAAQAAISAQIAEELKLKAAEDEKIAAEQKAEASLSRRRITTRVFRLSHVSADEVAERFNAMWNGDFGIAWKVSKIAQAFPESNSVIVTAPTMILDACSEIVNSIDVEIPQVYIEARFIELSNNASHKLGIDWQMLDGMKGGVDLEAGWNKRKMQGVTSYNSSDGSYTIGPMTDASGNLIEPGRSSANLSYINGTIGMSELSLVLRALESSEDARTFSNPKIIVSSGKKATVDMTTKYPSITISGKRTINGDNISMDMDMKMTAIPGEDKFMFAKEAFFSWGISLEVTPRIGTNGLINVQIIPTISSLDSWVVPEFGSSKDGDFPSSKYPQLNVQRLVTEFNMSSGTTAVIGGLSRTIETQRDSGIPWLRDWWWIGPRLFGSKVRVKEQREIIVFVTVGIVDPKNIRKDAGLPKNAVLGRLYTNDIRREPGDRVRTRTEGIRSLDLRTLEEQYSDPRRTNNLNKATWSLRNVPVPFTKDPDYKQSEDNKKE